MKSGELRAGIITAVWLVIFSLPTMTVIGYFRDSIEWYIMMPLVFISTMLLVVLFFRYCKWRNKKIISLIETKG